MADGSFVVPLLYISGLDPRAAAATSALVVSGSGISGFISHLATAAKPELGRLAGFSVAVLAGSQIGSRLMSTRLKSTCAKSHLWSGVVGRGGIIDIE